VCEVDAPQTSAFVVTAGERSTLVTLSGDFDILTVRALTSEVETFLATAPTDVVFDLSTLDFIDSSGIALLLKIHSRVVKDGCGSIRVVHPSDAARRTFELCGLTEAFGFDVAEIGDAG
jgi:anti-sigma B factor antagonist